jgi:hypothetical protein
VGWNAATVCLHQAIFLEEDRRNIIADDVKHYFDCIKNHLRAGPLMPIWNADETRIGSPPKQQVPAVVVFASTGPGLITAPESRDDSQLTFLTASSVFGGAIPPLFLSESQTFEKNRLAKQ